MSAGEGDEARLFEWLLSGRLIVSNGSGAVFGLAIHERPEYVLKQKLALCMYLIRVRNIGSAIDRP